MLVQAHPPARAAARYSPRPGLSRHLRSYISPGNPCSALRHRLAMTSGPSIRTEPLRGSLPLRRSKSGPASQSARGGGAAEVPDVRQLGALATRPVRGRPQDRRSQPEPQAASISCHGGGVGGRMNRSVDGALTSRMRQRRLLSAWRWDELKPKNLDLNRSSENSAGIYVTIHDQTRSHA